MNTSPLFKYIINCLYYNNLIIAGEKRRGCAIKQKGDSLIPLSYLDALEATMCMIVWDSLIETYTDQLHRINNIIGPTIPSILKCFASIFFGTLSTNMLSNWNWILKKVTSYLKQKHWHLCETKTFSIWFRQPNTQQFDQIENWEHEVGRSPQICTVF